MLDDKVGHLDIDFAGEFDEAGAEIVFLRLPGEIEGVDGDAVAAQSGAGIESMKAKRLGTGGVDDFVNIDAHAHAELLELIHERDVDAAIDVLEQLGHFGYGGTADRNGATEDGAVDGRGHFNGAGAASADDLGNVVAGDGVVARVFAFGRKGHVEATCGGASGAFGAGNFESQQIALLEQGHDDVFGGARIGSAFENNELAVVDMGGDGLDGAGDVAQIGLVILVEGGGNADDDGVHGGDLRVIGGGGEAGLLRPLDVLRKNADDVGVAGIELADLVECDVEAGDAEFFFAEQQCQRQADVSHAHDADAGLPGCDPLLEVCECAVE